MIDGMELGTRTKARELEQLGGWGKMPSVGWRSGELRWFSGDNVGSASACRHCGFAWAGHLRGRDSAS